MPIPPLMSDKFLRVIAGALTIALGLVTFIPSATAVGFQQVSIPETADRPLASLPIRGGVARPHSW